MTDRLIQRFDHAVVAARDLEAASGRYQALGFEVRPGGRHVGLGTHNAIVRFGADYLELLSIYDRELALAGGERRSELVDFLDWTEGSIGFALAVSDLDALANRLRENEVEMEGPFEMSRERPDGRMLSWRLVIPWRSAWLRPWPFFIEWDAPDEERLSWDPPSRHANGATGVRGVEVGTDQLEETVRAYGRLGMEPAEEQGDRAIFRLGGAAIELLATEDRPDRSPASGLSRVVLRVEDLGTVRDLLAQAGTSFHEEARRLVVTGEDAVPLAFEEGTDG